MSKVKKPTSITTIKECEEALEWIDLELDKLDRNIRITSRAIFSPKKWTTAISGILWSKQVKQKTFDHICNSPFLSKLEGSARSDQSLQEIQLSRVMNTAKEVQAVCEETCSRLSGAVNEARAAVDQPVHVDERANRMVNRTSEALEARHAFTACNYEVLSDTHLKWAARRGNVQPPYNLVGVLGARNVDVIEKEG